MLIPWWGPNALGQQSESALEAVVSFSRHYMEFHMNQVKHHILLPYTSKSQQDFFMRYVDTIEVHIGGTSSVDVYSSISTQP